MQLADLYYALTLLRYGSSKLYPHLMKRVDVFPQMLRETQESYRFTHCSGVVLKVVNECITCTSACILDTRLEVEAGSVKTQSSLSSGGTTGFSDAA